MDYVNRSFMIRHQSMELMAQVMERLYQELPEGKSRKKQE